MVEVLDWSGAADPQAIIQRAWETLERGELVGFPTDTVYAVAAAVGCAAAVERLHALSAPPVDRPLPLALVNPEQALDWAPGMSRLGRRLTRRCWPGPVTLVFADGIEQGLAGRLPESVRRILCPEGALALCVPDHDALWHVLRLSPEPLVLASLPPNGDGRPATAAELAQRMGDRVPLVIDGGPAEGKPASVVRVQGNRWEVLHEGAVSTEELGQQTTCLIIFVCTGNTCRSPMAEVLCAKLLAERLGCSPAELPQRGFLVLSAGLAAMSGVRAAAEAVEAARELGADLSRHSSQPLLPELVHQADHLLTMTQGHHAVVLSRFARYGPSPRLLCPEGNDIPDPLGADQETYRQCARTIQASLERLLPELVP
jgi:L-threonylcarbamoyladenylate synthase